MDGFGGGAGCVIISERSIASLRMVGLLAAAAAAASPTVIQQFLFYTATSAAAESGDDSRPSPAPPHSRPPSVACMDDNEEMREGGDASGSPLLSSALSVRCAGHRGRIVSTARVRSELVVGEPAGRAGKIPRKSNRVCLLVRDNAALVRPPSLARSIVQLGG